MLTPAQCCEQLLEVISPKASAFPHLEGQTAGLQSTEAPGTQLLAKGNGTSVQDGNCAAAFSAFLILSFKPNGPNSTLITIAFKFNGNADC